MGTQPTPWAAAPVKKLREFAEIDEQFDAIERRLDELQARVASLTPLTAEANVEYRQQIGDGRWRFVPPETAETLRAQGKVVRPFLVQPAAAEPSRPELGPTRDVRYLGGS